MNDDTIRVLLVEDDEEDYIITRELLENAPAIMTDLTWCSSLADGTGRARDKEFDVILLDMELSDSHGWATFEGMHAAAPLVALILLTGIADDAIGIEAVRHGAQDYLMKGLVDAERLGRSIRYAMERKRAEVELRQYREQLEEMVDRATHELLTANADLQREVREREAVEKQLREAVTRLEAHNAAKNQFVSNVSHELKTPLASITYSLENLSKGVAGPVDERVQTYVGMMQEDCHRLTGTVNDVLDMSRIEENRLELNRMKLHLGRFVGRAVEALRIQAEQKHHSLSLSEDGSRLFVSCDPQKMERVVQNLVSNAIKYTPEGGALEISVRTDSRQPDTVILDVIDNGIGIPPKHLPKVMERYYRIGEHVDGTGIGLALCREMVDMHGGILQMFSPPPSRDCGTQACVHLPAAPPPRVLAVDDEEGVLGVLDAQLNSGGYDAVCCGDGETALDLLHQEPKPDILIIDLFLPGTEGADVIAQIKTNEDLRYLPILAITGHELDTTNRGVLEAFGVPALGKPWRQDDLITCLEDVTIGKHYLRT